MKPIDINDILYIAGIILLGAGCFLFNPLYLFFLGGIVLVFAGFAGIGKRGEE